MNKGFTSGCGSQIRTDDLRVMSPTSYRAAPSRDISTQEVFSWVLIYYIMLNAICQVFFQKKLKKIIELKAPWQKAARTARRPPLWSRFSVRRRSSFRRACSRFPRWSSCGADALPCRAPFRRSCRGRGASRRRWWSSVLCRRAERAPWASAEVCGRWIPSAPRPACGTLPHCLFGW